MLSISLMVSHIGSANGLVPSGNESLPEPTNVDPDLCHFMASLGHSVLTLNLTDFFSANQHKFIKRWQAIIWSNDDLDHQFINVD